MELQLIPLSFRRELTFENLNQRESFGVNFAQEKGWRIKINSVSKFVSLMNNNILNNSSQLNKIKKEAINYCNNYFMPINYATLFEDISKKN